jgi:prephenate dehydrogenase
LQLNAPFLVPSPIVISSPPNCVAVFGPGLLGGSLLMALRKHSPKVRLHAWARRSEAAQDLQVRNLADLATTDAAQACEGADLIVLCTPLENMAALAEGIANAKPSPECVITDVGSVKGAVVSALEQVFPKTGFHFIGSHPMAGSERAGIEAARADLFEGSVCVVTPTLFTTDHALQQVRWLWSLIGCRIVEMPPDEHDAKVARISHLAHLTAAVTALAALRSDISASDCAGNGFRDTTRVASGDPDLWAGIISQNRAEVTAALKDARTALAELLDAVESHDDKALLRLLREAKLLRDSALSGGPVS